MGKELVFFFLVERSGEVRVGRSHAVYGWKKNLGRITMTSVERNSRKVIAWTPTSVAHGAPTLHTLGLAGKEVALVSPFSPVLSSTEELSSNHLILCRALN